MVSEKDPCRIFVPERDDTARTSITFYPSIFNLTRMDYITIGALAVAAAGVLAGTVPAFMEDRRERRKREAEEAEQRREHETVMRQAEIAQSLMYHAMNYDFVRDTIAGGIVEPGYLEKVRDVIKVDETPNPGV